MAVTPCQKPSDLSGPCLLLTGNLKVPFLASLCQRLQGAPSSEGGWVGGGGGGVIGQFHFLWWDPFKPFCQFLPEGLKSSEPSDILKCAPPVAVPQTRSCSLSLYLLTPYSVFTVGQVKLVCLQTECLRSLSSIPPTPHPPFCNYFALISGKWTPQT